MDRIVEPEILDWIDPAHPDAVKSRADLCRINALMGNHRWIAGQLRRSLSESGQILELGAGDGSLAQLLRRKIPPLKGRFRAVDLGDRPSDWPNGFLWHKADLLALLDNDAFWRPVKVVIANLFLHHFTDEVLRKLGRRLRNVEVILACEPTRRALHLVQGRLAGPFLNRITRHDLKVSVKAGFLEEELPELLGLDATSWLWETQATFFGSYRLRAVKLHSRS